MKRPKRTSVTHRRIALWWAENRPDILETCRNKSGFSDYEDWQFCWSCGKVDIKPQKCHLITRVFDGLDTEANLCLMCKSCHSSHPDAKPGHEQVALSWLAQSPSQVDLIAGLIKQGLLQPDAPGHRVYALMSAARLSASYELFDRISADQSA